MTCLIFFFKRLDSGWMWYHQCSLLIPRMIGFSCKSFAYHVRTHLRHGAKMSVVSRPKEMLTYLNRRKRSLWKMRPRHELTQSKVTKSQNHLHLIVFKCKWFMQHFAKLLYVAKLFFGFFFFSAAPFHTRQFRSAVFIPALVNRIIIKQGKQWGGGEVFWSGWDMKAGEVRCLDRSPFSGH